MSPKVRVLHLRDSPWVDGPGRTILETGSHLDPSRVEFHIGALVPHGKADHPLVDVARQRGLNVIEFRDPGGFGGPLIDEIVEVIDRHKINVLHSSEFRTRVVAQLCRLRRRVHLVTTAHGWIANNRSRKTVRFIDKVMLRFSDRVILVSHAVRRLVPMWWLSARRAHVLHNALVLSVYGREVLERPRRPVDTTGRVTILNVGRLSPEKGQDMLIRAVHRLLPQCPGLHLRIAGIGPLEAPLRALAESLNIADHVEFVGYVTDMPPLYRDCDIVVQSSFTEGLPNVILESAYLRVPLLATAVGGTDEVVRHGESAWLIRPDLEELVAGLQRFLAQPQEFVRMAERGHADVLANFSFDVRTERLTRIYESMLGVS
jgi:glycosyltransferase involved in cell wall biosynthesis